MQRRIVVPATPRSLLLSPQCPHRLSYIHSTQKVQFSTDVNQCNKSTKDKQHEESIAVENLLSRIEST
jgi:hypothetical protein